MLEVDAKSLKRWLNDGGEIALLDVRETGQYGAGHPFFAVSVPWSRFEARLPALVPNIRTRLVLFDDGDGIAELATIAAEDMGYDNVHVLSGGARAWASAGYTLFDGVNLPSKVFGELLEAERGTPHISARELDRRQRAGDDLVVVDGRPFAEFARMSIPHARCCPNGELALRIDALVPDQRTTIVVNCAGRTRSILGAQTLIDLGLCNPVLALENGTQGWFLAGLELDRGASGAGLPDVQPSQLASLSERADGFAKRAGVACVPVEQLGDWLSDTDRTTYVFDVRSAHELAAGSPGCAVHAPGGQLIQATDQWVGVRGARIVLVDAEMVRAPVVAGWLRQMGHDACVLDGGVEAARALPARRLAHSSALSEPIAQAAVSSVRAANDPTVIDLRSSARFRQRHIEGALWCIRPRLRTLPLSPEREILLVAEDAVTGLLARRELHRLGVTAPVALLPDDPQFWRRAGLGIVEGSELPNDQERIDFVFHTHDRHHGNAAAARAYLAWETGLLDRIDEQERRIFRIAAGAGSATA